MKVNKQCCPSNKVVFRRKTLCWWLETQPGDLYVDFPKCRYFPGAILFPFFLEVTSEKMHAHPRSLLTCIWIFIISKINASLSGNRLWPITKRSYSENRKRPAGLNKHSVIYISHNEQNGSFCAIFSGLHWSWKFQILRFQETSSSEGTTVAIKPH